MDDSRDYCRGKLNARYLPLQSEIYLDITENRLISNIYIETDSPGVRQSRLSGDWTGTPTSPPSWATSSSTWTSPARATVETTVGSLWTVSWDSERPEISLRSFGNFICWKYFPHQTRGWSCRRVGNYPFIDARNIGVWGRGFGGYLTVKVLAQSERLLRCGAAVSPISVWQHYNPLLTQRYLGRLSIDTWEQYSKADLTRYHHYLRSLAGVIIPTGLDAWCCMGDSMSFNIFIKTSS